MRTSQHIMIAFALMLILAFARQPSRAAGPNTSTYLPLIIAQKPTTQATATTTAPPLTTTSTATATGTATPTATATPTSTASATATTVRPVSCFETAGTYPIGVDASVLDEHGFIAPDRIYDQAPYQGMAMKRLRMREVNVPGQFLWLRWKADPSHASAPALREMLTIPGTLNQGFDEAHWPPTTNLIQPAGYPAFPQQLSPGDWVYGNSSLSDTVDVELTTFITNQTLLRLPLYDDATGNGANATAHVIRPAIFVLANRGRNTQDGWYIDLVYIGESALVACNP